MSGLIPTELHRYSIGDISRGLMAARKSGERQPAISLPGLGDGIPIRSARAAVIVAFKALGMPPGSRVGVPLYCCPVVFKAIKAAGCVPRFLDIDPETFCLSSEDLRAKRSGIDALIAVHMFGNLCDMPKILEIIEGKPVLEDCAQSIGSKLDGRACGSFGDIGFFSFRSGKYLSVGEGGALFSENKGLRERISELTAALPVPTRAQEMKHLIETYIRSKLRSRPLWGLVGSRIWAIYNKKTEFADKSPLVLGRIFASDLATVRRRLPRLDSMIASQRAHAEYFERNLKLDLRMLCREGPRAHYNRFMYPIIFPSTEQRDRMAAHLRRCGVGTSRPYKEVITGAAEHYGYEGDCPSAEHTLRRTLVIPSFYTLKPNDIKHIVRSVNQAYSSSDEVRGILP
jgi:dTDP-4-amino-4,6-dideoxygalactose transaminase